MCYVLKLSSKHLDNPLSYLHAFIGHIPGAKIAVHAKDEKVLKIGVGTGPVTLADIACDLDSAQSMANCSKTGSTCTHNHDIIIKCEGKSCVM